MGAGICRYNLGPLTPQDAYHYFNQLGLHSSLSNVIEIGEKLHYHPYSLRLLAGAAGAIGGLDNLSKPLMYKDSAVTWRNILAWAFYQMPASTQQTLRHLTSYIHSIPNTQLYESHFTHTLDEDLEQLQRRGFIMRRERERKTYYTLPRVVRRFLADLPAVIEVETAQNLTPLLQRLIHPQPEQSTTKPSANAHAQPIDVASAKLEYQHLIQQKQYDEALTLYRQNLVGWINPESNNSQVQIELIRALFPIEPGELPLVTQPTEQAWLLTKLAGLYTHVGRPRLAISQLEQANRIYTQFKRNHTFGRQCQPVGTKSTTGWQFGGGRPQFATGNYPISICV